MTSARKIKKRNKRLAEYNRTIGPAAPEELVPTNNMPMDLAIVEEMLDQVITEVSDLTTHTAAPIKAAVVISERALTLDRDLIEAVEKLTESMEFKVKEESKSGVKGWIQNKKDSLSQMFTIPGLAKAAGIGQDPSSLIGSIFNKMEENQIKKSEERAEKAKYITEFSQLTEVGRGMSRTEAMTEGARRFEELKKLNPELESLESKEKRARDFGGSLSESDLARKEALLEKRKELQNYASAQIIKPQATVVDKETMDGFKAGVLTELAESTPKEREMFLSQDPEMIKSIFEGAVSELAGLSEKQLEMLKSIDETLHKNEEELHEANLRKGHIPTLVSKNEPKQEEQGGIIDTIISGLSTAGSMLGRGVAAAKGAAAAGKAAIMGGLATAKGAIGTGIGAAKGAIGTGIGAAKGAIGTGIGAAKGAIGTGIGAAKSAGAGLLRVLPAVGKAVLPAAAVAGAGYAGWRAGGWLNENVVNPTVSRLTGVENNTLGSAIYDWMNPADANRPGNTNRINQSQQLQNNERSRAELENQNRQNIPPVVNNVSDNRSQITNNSTVMKIPVRNQEPTINNRFDRMLHA